MKKKCYLSVVLDVNNKCHPEFISGSHLVSNLKSGGIPYQVHNDVIFYNGGFTLIELLVVVLIIGILAAVALPQYKFAVAKARMTQLITIANSVVQAEERYYLANGQYTNKPDELDIEFQGTVSGSQITNPAGWEFHLMLANVDANYVSVSDSRLSGIRLSFGYSVNGNATWSNLRGCYAEKDSVQANELCKHFSGKSNKNGQSPGYNLYYLHK